MNSTGFSLQGTTHISTHKAPLKLLHQQRRQDSTELGGCTAPNAKTLQWPTLHDLADELNDPKICNLVQLVQQQLE